MEVVLSEFGWDGPKAPAASIQVRSECILLLEQLMLLLVLFSKLFRERDIFKNVIVLASK